MTPRSKRRITRKQKKRIITDFVSILVKGQRPLPPEFYRVVDEGFWELL